MAEKPHIPVVLEAISAAGGTTSLMNALNERGWEIKSHNVISQWRENGIPPKYCPDIEELYNIPCERLCPEVKWGIVRDRRRANRQQSKPPTLAPS